MITFNSLTSLSGTANCWTENKQLSNTVPITESIGNTNERSLKWREFEDSIVLTFKSPDQVPVG